MSSAAPTARDAVRAVVVTAACLLMTRLLWGGTAEQGRDFDALTVLLTVAGCAPTLLWRTFPLVPAISALASVLALALLDAPFTGALVLALGLVGLTASRAEGRMTGSLGVLSGAVLAATVYTQADDEPLLAGIGGFAVGMVPALIGERLRAERARATAAQELAQRIEELRDRDVERAVAEERLRIARDVHDITGHHLSAISLLAAGAGRTTEDPDARGAFERIHGLTREALGQTRSVLGVLRHDDEAVALAPLPRLAHVERLLEPAQAAGLAVDVQVEGRARELSETVELCAYRVIQESLTNVVRHAGARSVDVAVGYGDETLTVAVHDDGRPGPVRAGSGIEGMRERVALVGGQLAAGPRAGGGWSVRATIPLAP